MKRVDSQNGIDKAKSLTSNGFLICLTLNNNYDIHK